MTAMVTPLLMDDFAIQNSIQQKLAGVARRSSGDQKTTPHCCLWTSVQREVMIFPAGLNPRPPQQIKPCLLHMILI